MTKMHFENNKKERECLIDISAVNEGNLYTIYSFSMI